MLSKVCSAALNGVEAYPVKVEVNVGHGGTFIAEMFYILPAGLIARQNLSRLTVFSIRKGD
jgi:hypothetical protein